MSNTGGVGPKEFILDESQKDIRQDSKRKLGDYLSKRTTGGSETFTPPEQGGGEYTYLPSTPNKYPIEPSSTEVAANASVTLPLDSNQKTFASQNDINRSYESNIKQQVSINPSAYRNNPSVPDGNEVLSSDSTKNLIESKVLSQNRFTSSNKFTSGQFKNSQPASPINENENIFDTMRKAALASMLNAAGGSSGPGNLFGINDDKGEDTVKNELARIGIAPFNPEKVNVDDLRLLDKNKKNISPPRPEGDQSYFQKWYGRDTQFSGEGMINPDVDDLNGFENNTDVTGASEVQYNKKTYGQLNSYLKNFSGTGTISEIGLALLAYGALFLAVAVVSLIISLIVGRLPRPNPQTQTLPLGSERGPRFGQFLFGNDEESGFTVILQNIGNIISKLLGVMQPYDGPILISYWTAALEGALSIIGVDTDAIADNPSGGLVSSAANITINFGTAPGYYLVLIREIARDLSFGVSQSALESSIFGIFNAISNLKLVRFVDTCARLGIVNQARRDRDNSSDADDASRDKVAGAPDTIPVTLTTNYWAVAQARVGRSREVIGSKRLAWSHTSIGYTRTELITKDMLRAYKNYPIEAGGGKTSGIAAVRKLRSKKVVSDTGRIDDETRRYHEDLLDAEYMPFYFHDLRTNEILSFHAFLSSLSDSFSPNYSSVDGFGRMDSIQIYKNTTRSIGLGFFVVATSPEDHDNMWHSINKFVNMVYPQWNDGDEINDGNNVFTQPFSQTIASSPMVRMRIGDVIHSNYSRFALGRIFGLDKSSSKIGGTDSDVNADAQNVDGSIGDITTRTEDIDTPNFVKPTGNSSLNLNRSPSAAGENDLISAASDTILAGINPSTGEINPGRYKLYTSREDAIAQTGGKTKRLLKSNAKIIAYVPSDNRRDNSSLLVAELDSKQTFNNVEYTHAVVKSDDFTVNNQPSPAPPPIPSATITQNTQASFLDPTINPIVRSFEDGAGGRGLAGFITSLTVDYGNTDVTWGVEQGSRAPTIVSLSINFAPIHDIPMGLGADGTARSVAYPVGDITRQRHMPDLVQRDIQSKLFRKG